MKGRGTDADRKKLTDAIDDEDLDAVKALIKADRSLLNQPDEQKYTPLMESVNSMSMPVMIYLLNEGASKAGVNIFGQDLMDIAKKTARHMSDFRAEKMMHELLDIPPDDDEKPWDGDGYESHGGRKKRKTRKVVRKKKTTRKSNGRRR